jgi:hypothetical protein
MKKYTNAPMLARNRAIGTYGGLAGMLVLVGGLVASFMDAEKYLTLSYAALLAGFVLVNVANYFTARWGRTPAPDAALDIVLKGLDDNYTLAHFRLGAEHALFTPEGPWAVVLKYEKGTISYDGKRWRQGGVSALSKIFGAEAVGEPILDAEAEAKNLAKKLKKILREDTPPVRSMVVFINDKARLELENTPVPVLHAAKAKDFIRHLPKGPNLTSEQFQRVLEYLGEPS